MYATAINTDLISQFEAMDIENEIETKDNENQNFIEIENGSNNRKTGGGRHDSTGEIVPKPVQDIDCRESRRCL